MMIYVDDPLSLLDQLSAPLWASLIVILLCIFRAPMSWHKASLSPHVFIFALGLTWRLACLGLPVSHFPFFLAFQRADVLTSR
jgi:hypothetical protein